MYKISVNENKKMYYLFVIDLFTSSLRKNVGLLTKIPRINNSVINVKT
jgi:hypothetical protein